MRHVSVKIREHPGVQCVNVKNSNKCEIRYTEFHSLQCDLLLTTVMVRYYN
jgi:hypothetical protein